MSPPSASEAAGSVAKVLDRRLATHDGAPLLVALSGGGDSLFLLLAARAWAQGAGRTVIAATVDHDLRPESADWTSQCEARCRALGVAHGAVVWQGAKPRAGIHAAARQARHRLLAAAARAAGAQVILMGHTADDILEADWMRRHGGRTPAPREWSPSPVWPEGRDLFILRPLLGLRRVVIRSALAAAEERWIDDPGNQDTASLRVRARRALAGHRGEIDRAIASTPLDDSPFREGVVGELGASLEALLAPGDTTPGARLAIALVCGGGGERTPRARALDLIFARLADGRPFAASLAGARLDFDGSDIVIAREAKDERGGTARDLILEVGRPTVWDGRFEFTADAPDWSVGFVAGRAARLSRGDAAALRQAPACARGAAPLLLAPDGTARFPLAGAVDGMASRRLVAGRLAANSGAIQHESAIATWRNACACPKSIGQASEEAVDEPS